MKPASFSKPYLGKLLVKKCPWCNNEFKTDKKSQAYCSATHKKNAEVSRRRQRQYFDREDIPVSSKPGASYRVAVQKEILVAPTMNVMPSKEVEYYLKAPIRHSADLPVSGAYNLPDLSSGECRHGEIGYCVFCDFR